MIEATALGRAGGIRHGFFTREGGVSEGPFASLNMGLRGGDDPWTFTAFMVSPNARLDGETPLAVLRRGELNNVMRAVEAHGEHGAA